MKLRTAIYGFLLMFILQVFFINKNAYPALQEVNLGVYGAKVRDIATYNNGGATDILIAIDSPRGVYRWTSGSSTTWEALTYPDVPGEASQVEFNLASGYEDDVYTVITEIAGGSYTPGIYASDIAGDPGSWVSVSSVPLTSIQAGRYPAILVGHSSGMYVATLDGNIYRNTGGISNSFTAIYSNASVEIASLSVYDANTLYFMTYSGGSYSLYRLDVPSSSLTSIALPASTPSGSGSVDVYLVGVDPTDEKIIFVAGGSENPQVYKSVDGGTTWSSSWDHNNSGTSNFPGGYPQYIKFSNNRVFISASVLDGSSTEWSHAPTLSSTVGTNTVETHPNDGALEIDPNDSTIVYMGTDWGIGQLTYASSLWSTGSEIGNNDGIEGIMLIDMEFYEYASTHKDLWIATKSGAGRANYFDPTDPTSTEAPEDWLFPIFPEVDGPPVTEVAIHPTDTTIVFIGNNAGRVYKTTTGTSTTPSWTKVFQAEDYTGVFGTSRPDHSEITSVQFVPSTPSRMYLSGFNWESGTDGGVFYSDDTGSTWYEDSSISGVPVNDLWVTDSTVWAGVGNSKSSETGLRARTSVTSSGNWWSPSTGLSLDNEIVNSLTGTTVGGTMTVYVATSGGVYKGEVDPVTATSFSDWTWTSLTSAIGSINTDFASVTIDPDNPDTVYAAVSNCVYESTDGGANWSVLSTTCTNVDEEVYVLKYDDLMAGTAAGLFTFVSAEPSATPTPAISPLPSPGPSAQPTPHPVITVTPGITPTPAASPTPSATATPVTKGKIAGSVVDTDGEPVGSVKLKLKGKGTGYLENTVSDEEGLFEFTDLSADKYVIVAKKRGYKKTRKTIRLEEGEEKTGIVIKLKEID